MAENLAEDMYEFSRMIGVTSSAEAMEQHLDSAVKPLSSYVDTFSEFIASEGVQFNQYATIAMGRIYPLWTRYSGGGITVAVDKRHANLNYKGVLAGSAEGHIQLVVVTSDQFRSNYTDLVVDADDTEMETNVRSKGLYFSIRAFCNAVNALTDGAAYSDVVVAPVSPDNFDF